MLYFYSLLITLKNATESKFDDSNEVDFLKSMKDSLLKTFQTKEFSNVNIFKAFLKNSVRVNYLAIPSLKNTNT